jgi:hypothetical protein
MSSEEMREELESFVNRGIEKGWEGWPLKDWPFDTDQCRLAHDGEINLFDRIQAGFLSVEGRLDRLFRTGLQGVDRLS